MQTLILFDARVLFFLFLSLQACAEVPSVSPEKTTTSLGLAIDVLAQPKVVDLPGRFSIAIRLQNPSIYSLTLKNFLLRSVETPTRLEISDGCTSKVEQVYVEPNNSLILTCEIFTPGYHDSFRGFFTPLLTGWSLLTFQPGDYQFVAVATAHGTDSSDESFVVVTHKAFPIRLTPTVWQAIFGAMLGSLLMVSFWVTSPKIRSLVGIRSASALYWNEFLARVLQAVGLWCGSTSAASIAIFLTFRLKDAALPFTLSVNDFYGGLVVGLFGVVLTNWLGQKLFGSGEVERV